MEHDSNDSVSPLETIPAGLSSLPRQLAIFAEVRQQLLQRLADPNNTQRQQILESWRPSGDDYGLLWIDSWAYIADVLGFYDERIANESYIGTAVRRPALRRLVQLLGYTPRPGIAATASVAAIADGRAQLHLPIATGFRSRGFAGEPPQVFETGVAQSIHPLFNSWTVTPFRRRPTVDLATGIGGLTVGEDNSSKSNKGSNTTEKSLNKISELLMDPIGYGLSVDALVIIEARDRVGTEFTSRVTQVVGSEPFTGKDEKAYVKIKLKPDIAIEPDVDLLSLRALRPTQILRATHNQPIGEGKSSPSALSNTSIDSIRITQLFVDQFSSGLRLGDTVVAVKASNTDDPEYKLATVHAIEAAAVRVVGIPEETITIPDEPDVVVPSPAIAATRIELIPPLPGDFANAPNSVTFHYSMTNGGSPTNTCKMFVSADELSDPEGIPINGTVELPTSSTDTLAQLLSIDGIGAGQLEQPFLFNDADGIGLLVDGRLTVGSDGKASFQALVREQIIVEQLRLPLTLYGNVVDTTRGESVYGEVLGSGDAKKINQKFKLKKKPLTYTHNLSSQSTLVIRVDGIRWQEVNSFFACGPADEVYVVQHDDMNNTWITFGDGLRGTRLNSGIGNIVADYRFGAGYKAPPADHIRQLAAALKGLRGVKSPVRAYPGKDPESVEQLRTNAPQTAMLLGRAVSVADFQALAEDAPGVVKASAQWGWIDSQMQAGVVVHYIGVTTESTIRNVLGSRADPGIAIDVTQAKAINTHVSIEVQIDPRYATTTVGEALREHLAIGMLSIEQASIGGTFWSSDLHKAASAVAGVIAITGLSFTTRSTTLTISEGSGTCIDTGCYLDFSADDAIRVYAVYASELPPVVKGKSA